MSKSPYIEASKHADFTRAVEGHFFGGEDPRRLVNASPGGDPARNNNVDFPFNTDRGVNYVPDSEAGHKV
jgi:hypothetical protein